jgi:hypothetical protein
MLVLERKRRRECWKNNTKNAMLKDNHCWDELYAENGMIGLL